MGSTSSIVNLYITIFTGLAVGANVVIARLIGAEEEGEVRKRSIPLWWWRFFAVRC